VVPPAEQDAEFYDYFNIFLSDINVKLVTNFEHALLDNFNLNLQLARCKIPLDPHLAMFKITGKTSDISGTMNILEYQEL
jgi:hypothetical protein